MNISKEFLEVLQLSFEVKDLSKDSNSWKEKNKMIKAIEDKIYMLYDIMNVNIKTVVEFDNIVVLAVVYYNLGLVYIKSKKHYKLHTALRFFEMCLELLQKRETDCKAILISISAFNKIHLVFYKLGKDRYTSTSLNSAMKLYLAYTKENNYPDPIHIPTIIGIKEEESNLRIILEKLHFTTLRDIATQYSVQPGDKHDFVIHMYSLLKEHFSEIMAEGKQFREDCLDWILTLCDMCKYLLINNRFVEARNYIATADYVLFRFSEDSLKTINQQNDESKLRFLYLSDAYDYVRGVIARSWGTYGVLLLRFWLEQFLQNKGKKCEMDTSDLVIETKKESANLLIFFDVKEETERITNQITDTCILNFENAKSVFMKIMKHLDEAKAYFTVDTDIESYAQITLEVSAAHKYLAGFEQRRDNQLKLHKRRVEYLENVCKKFNAIIDTDAEFQIYKRVWYEMVTSCSTVMDLMREERYHDNKTLSREVDRFAKLILGNIDLYLNIS